MSQRHNYATPPSSFDSYNKLSVVPDDEELTSTQHEETTTTANTNEQPPQVETITADFIALKLRNDATGHFDLTKAQQFHRELLERRAELQQQIHDTRYSERILRDVHTNRDALKNAHKKSTFGGSPILKGFDVALLPQMEAIIQMIENEENEDTIRLAAEEFVRAYSPYEMPNPMVTDWNLNNQAWAVALKMFFAWGRKKDDRLEQAKKKPVLESVNLDVELKEHREEIGAILGKDIPQGYRLTAEETATLKDNGFDLSQLNPGSTAFWGTRQALAEWDESQFSEYPLPEERITYLAPRYRSNYSTKMTAYVWRNGEKHRFKVKLGPEVHSEILVVRLRQLMGFHGDHMKWFPSIKMYLGDKSYPQWERDLQVKYGTEQIRRHILQRGYDQDSGEAWVVLRDIAIEARPANQVRVSAIDYGSYDGQRQREIRASALIYAFFALGDHSNKNLRQVLVQDPDGAYHLEHRAHDVGTTMGRSPMLLRGPRDILNFPLSKNKPEEYDRDYVWADKSGNVKFIWNDYWHHLRDHSGATYSDFKWAARLISSLTIDEIAEAVTSAGIPNDLVNSYVYHIVNMRNRAAKAFDLEHGSFSIPGRGPIQVDLPTPPTELVRADGYQVIKKGKIVGMYYPNSTILPLLQETWFTKINGMLSGRSIGRDIAGQYVEASFGPLVRLDTSIGRTLWEREVPWTMTTFSVGIGINATVARIVTPNHLYVGAQGRSRAYVVKDTLGFSLGVGMPAVSSLLARLGPELSVSLQFLRRTYQHVHFAESVSEGYRSPVHVHKLAKITGDMERLAVEILTPGDVLREHKAVGASTAAHAGLGFTAPYVGVASVGSSISLEAGQTIWQTTSYTKDPIGSLHMLLERDNEGTLGAGTEQVNVNASAVVNAAAFALGAHRHRLNYNVWNIEVAPKAYDLENATDGVVRNGPEADELVATLKVLRNQPELILPGSKARSGLPDNVKLRFHAKANKQEKRSNAQLLYILNHDRKREQTDFKVETDDYEYKFFSQSRAKRGYAGIEKTMLDLRTTNFFVKQGTSKRLTVEMDRQNPRSLVVWVDIFDYHRTLDRPALLKLLNKLNNRYGNPNGDANEVFYVEPPQASDDKPYRRIYANARIYVNGDKLLNIVQNSDPTTLTKQLHASKLSLRQKRKIKAAFKELTKAIEQLNKITAESSEKTVTKVQNRLAQAAMTAVNHMYQSKKWGVQLLHQLLGEDGMLVIGEIFGIHDRTNMLQDPDWVSRVRYAGKSWGKLTNIPPVSKFVRVDQPTPANEHARLDIPMERFVGNIVTMYSGGWVGLGSR